MVETIHTNKRRAQRVESKLPVTTFLDILIKGSLGRRGVRLRSQTISVSGIIDKNSGSRGEYR